MIGRVTQQTVQRSTLANLQLNLSAMAQLQGKLSSNKSITKPSDDPAGTGSAMALRGSLRANAQHSRNIDDGNGWLSTINTAMQSSIDTLGRVRDLTVQGASSGTMDATAREAIAVEIDGLRDSLLSEANTSYLGRSVFAGTSDVGSAVTVTNVPDPLVPGSTRTYTSNSVPGTSVQRRVDANTLVRVDVDGSAAFGAGGGSIFATLDRISATLRTSGPLTGEIAALDVHRDAMLSQLSGVGARHGQVLSAQYRALDTKTGILGRLSGVEDVDLAATVVQLQAQEVSYKAALGATARVLQPTLLDFLH
ncbi:flagellar hook-associated protein 3 [Pengzhenrongella sp.]|jgi:flagellar hook-associated protein 3 FlgL|uniref:flagellin N-terminal helical domain-containing protein n=1 Tax=Pengzhenrongella sp. TaxID=2888820 RepID=UPI002F9467BA